MELTKYAGKLQSEGRSIIHLSIGEPDFTAPAPVVKALHAAADAGRTQYTDAAGLAPLREAIARDYHDHWGVDVDPDRILVTAGASAALTLACAALVNPGDGVLVADPGYPCNRHFVAAFDGVAQLVETTAASRFQLTRENLQANWQTNTRGALISSPANPTGTSIPTAEMGQILSAIREREGFAIVDEIYLGLSYQDEVATALTHGNDMVITNSFSKYFNMTGWRLGWLVVPEEWRATFEKLAQNLLICASALSQQAALACFDPESRATYEERKAQFKARRDFLVPALEGIGLKVPAAPDGAFYIYADISAFSDDSSSFAYDLLNNTGVALVPGKDFGQKDSNKFVRISYANSMDNLREAVDRIDSFVNKRA
ncbi:MAG: pyridoxal phosphate-dependent aminotransferase [Burkholderiaceae bacterium]